MGSLLDMLKGVENEPENESTIPDTVPDAWLPDLAPDPTPGDAPAVRPKAAPRTTGAITAPLKKRIAAEIEMYVEFAAMPILMRDPVCGGAIHEQAAPIAAAITQILSKYPDLAHKFLATGAVGDWMKLALALQPVGKAVWDHHVVKAEQEVHPDDQLDLNDFSPYRPGQ